MILEVCIASVEDAIAAAKGGAGRLELNLGLELGGLTPSIGLFRAVRKAVDLPILPMLRPRPGGFHYNNLEKETMLDDAKSFLEEGADGLVFGCLYANDQLDIPFTVQIAEMCGEKESVFHRAIDVPEEPFSILESLVDCGVTRVLTSGGQKTAIDGSATLKKMQTEFGGRIEILPASGIRSTNVLELIEATGVTQVHGSCSESYQNPSGPVAPPDCRRTDQIEVERMVQVLQSVKN